MYRHMQDQGYFVARCMVFTSGWLLLVAVPGFLSRIKAVVSCCLLVVAAGGLCEKRFAGSRW